MIVWNIFFIGIPLIGFLGFTILFTFFMSNLNMLTEARFKFWAFKTWILSISLLCLFLSQLFGIMALMDKRDQLEKSKNKKPDYEQVTETFYRQIK